MRLRPKHLHARIALWFCLVMVVACILSFFVVNVLHSSRVSQEVELSQDTVAGLIQRLSFETDLAATEIAALMTNSLFPIRYVEDLSPYQLTPAQQHTLETDHILSLQQTTLLQLPDGVLELRAAPMRAVFGAGTLYIALTLLFATIIGTLFITILAKRILKPFHTLNLATQQVAKGDFNVQVPNTLHDELGNLVENFNTMTRELGHMEMLRNDFIANVSHEFKTPISSIHGFATLLKNSPLNEEQKEYTQVILQEAERLSKLTTNILNLSKLENQEIITEKRLFSLDEQIRRAALLLANQWSNKDIHMDIALTPLQYYGNEALLQQVWVNLLDNAIKFTQSGGQIAIRSYDYGDTLRIVISDNGMGMDEQTRQRIFEKFFQGDPSHKAEGSGLGLSLVKRILDLCHGTITVKSRKGGGSAFTVDLPRTTK